MAINVEKYKESLLAAWKDVVDEKSNTDWALFSYEGQSNDLKVVSKGDGGIDEMREELNSGKIMYAFCKVFDTKTSLHKFVLVNWQGEGAPHHRKATSANHIRDVSNLLKGFHVTINARNEEEIDNDIVTEKLSKSSAYSFKDRGETIKESGPVGTTYKRVIPQQEINSNERDKFWQKEEEEEKQRQEAEKKRREEEKRRLENEIKQRELKEAAQREVKIKERSKSISVLREAERNEMLRVQAANVAEKGYDLEDREKEEMERKDRSELLRRQRSQEAQALISKRTIDARAVFEQNTSAGQLLHRRASYQPSSSSTSVISPVKEKVSPIAEKVRWPPTQQEELTPTHVSEARMPTQLVNNIVERDPIVEQSATPQQNNVPAQQNNGPVQQNNTMQQSNGPTQQNNGPVQENNIPVNGSEESAAQVNDVERAQPYLDDVYLNNGVILEDYEDLDLRAQALYDYQAADDTEISFDPGDIITRIDQIDAGWWQGMAPDGSYGLFPANYVQLLD